jgi:hypothetical protein
MALAVDARVMKASTPRRPPQGQAMTSKRKVRRRRALQSRGGARFRFFSAFSVWPGGGDEGDARLRAVTVGLNLARAANTPK